MVTKEETPRQRLPDRKKRKNKRKFKIALFCIKFILYIALPSAAVILLALSPLFNIKEITVEGNKHYDKEGIITKSGIITNSNGFKSVSGGAGKIITLRCGNAEQAILKNSPYIKELKVRFVPPGKIAIHIVERTPAFLVPYMGTSLIIDREGYVLDTAVDSNTSKLPMVKGLKLDTFTPGKKLPADNDKDLENIIKLSEALINSDKEDELKVMNKTKGYEISDDGAVNVLLDSRVTIKLGDLSDLDYRIKAMKQIFFKNIKKGERGLLDFTSGENPVFEPEETTEADIEK